MANLHDRGQRRLPGRPAAEGARVILMAGLIAADRRVAMPLTGVGTAVQINDTVLART
jgi:hypothetical protein